jgi:tetratricopeptide (TPR) repeat protein
MQIISFHVSIDKGDRSMKTAIFFLSTIVLFSACGQKQDATSEQAKEQPAAGMTQTPPARDISTAALVKIDEDIQKYADDVEAAKSKGDKVQLTQAYVAFGDYMQYASSVSPREGKYHRALVEYRKALELDPTNQKVVNEITQIEDIYRSMGRPIPGQE